MTISGAVQTLVQHVRETGTPLSEAIGIVWERVIPFSHEETKVLISESLAARAGVYLRNPLMPQEYSPRLSVVVRQEIMPEKRHEVTVQLLVETVYHVNGRAKAVAIFTVHDVSTKLQSLQQLEDGVVRHRKMWEYIAERLKQCKKNKVEDLGHGEQMKIARMLYDLKRFKQLELN